MDSSNHPITYFDHITKSATVSNVPTNPVAAKTTSATSIVGVVVVLLCLMPSVLLIFRVQVPAASCCGEQLIPSCDPGGMRHSPDPSSVAQ